MREKLLLPSRLVLSARVVAAESLKSAIKRKKKGFKFKCPESNNPAVCYDYASNAARRFSLHLKNTIKERTINILKSNGRYAIVATANKLLAVIYYML